ncbi:nuclease-related domain-containing protein [Psychrobacillus sp. NPDC096623]|uniref:nuclease-related domain-containing protein n=1 Tax=Psychrobacillus sp. NPDC096623 TaxID=3364492 RepID=UPI0037F45552
MLRDMDSREYNLIGLQMLGKRLNETHPQKEIIIAKAKAAKAGLHGERKISEVFEKYTFPFEYLLVENIGLNSNGYFQMDAIFLTPYFLVILESKNINGKLFFKQNPAMLERETAEGKIDVFESPEIQLSRNIYLLQEWLGKQVMTIPIHGVIVLSNPKVRVIEPPKKHSAILPQTIPVYLRNLPRENVYFDSGDMEKFCSQIKVGQQAYIPFPMCVRWGINPEDLRSGVCCENCNFHGMIKRKSGWICPSCGHFDKFAHEKAIRDWFMLISDTITNKQCRTFLHLESSEIAHRLLQSMNLIQTGTSRNRKYKWVW